MADETDQRRARFSGLYLLLALALVFAFQLAFRTQDARENVSHTELLQEIRAGRIESVDIREAEIRATRRGGESAEGDSVDGEVVTVGRLPNVDDPALMAALHEHGVEIRGEVAQESVLLAVLGWVFPLLLLLGFWWFMMQRMGGGRGGPMSFGRSKAKIYDLAKDSRVTFEDVAGVEEAKNELIEIVRFLKKPDEYRRIGARAPKGVLLVGAPGTGKTLLARAVAGEAEVPFFSLSGSDFVEMFVGVGAARVRDLFEQAKARAPCIVFIDELDALGKSRGHGGPFAGNDEREQTLNQLLVEIDGFDATAGVVLMAATNRPEILDAALLRAGRFDRQVLVDRPDIVGRTAILTVHAKRVKLATDVELETVARRTPGMVGADLANVVNEAALAATRRGADAAEQRDFEEAIDRIQLGLKKKSRVMNDEEKRRVAIHESGHALVAMSVTHADPVHRVTIIPRTIGALGVTLQLPTEERYLMTRSELVDRIAVMVGGRAAEELVLGEVSTGAQNDLERATELARQMVTRFGMSEELGPVAYGRSQASPFLSQGPGFEERNYSEETGRAIDAEIRTLVEDQYARAKALLAERRPALEAMVEELLGRETLDRDRLDALLGQTTS